MFPTISIALLMIALVALTVWVVRQRRELERMRRELTKLRRTADTNNEILKLVPDILLLVRADGTLDGLKLRSDASAPTALVKIPGKTLGNLFGRSSGSELLDLVKNCIEQRKVMRREHGVALVRSRLDFEIACHPLSENRALLVLQNVTELVQLRQTRDESITLAQGVATARADFMARLSHDLKNPLTGVLGAADLLLANHPNDHDRMFLEAILEAANQLVSLANDVNEYARTELGGQTREALVDVHFDELVGGVLDMFALEAQRKRLRLVGILEPTLPVVRTDRTRLTRILTNVVGNAIKFTDEGSVVVRVGWQDGEVHLSVRDTGVGIEKSELGTLFDPFVQAPSSGRGELGTGLGLAIAKQFTDSLGGSVSVESTPGTGTVFRFRWPMAVSARREPARRYLGRSALLEVQDDEEFESLAIHFSALGFQVERANSLQQLLARLSHHHGFSLVVVELGGAPEPARAKLAALPAAGVPLIALTDAISGPAHGFTASLLKPVKGSRVESLVAWLDLPPVQVGHSASG